MCLFVSSKMKREQQRNSTVFSGNTSEHGESNTIQHIIKSAYQANSQDIQLGIKLKHIQPILRKKIPREQQEPSFREITQLLAILRDKLADKNVSKIIKMLYYSLVKIKEDKCSATQKRKDFSCWEDFLEPNHIGVPTIASKEYIIRPQIREKKAIRKEDEQRYVQKQIVAKAFVVRDYGLQHLEAQILQTRSSVIIKRQRYTDLAYGVVTEGYRLLQHFLLNECKRSIKPSDKYQIGALHRVLCNCRILLKAEDSFTFLKFVRIAFNLESVAITEQDAVRLYISLQKTIRSRVGNRQLDRSIQKKQWTKYIGMQKRRLFKRDQFQRFVTPAIEKQIVNIYLKCEMFAKVKASLIEKYPDYKHLFTLESVGGVICKIVRITIKRVFYYKQKYKDANLPDLIHIDSSYRCKISKAGEALKVRRLLLKLWKTEQGKIIKKLPKVIHEINNYIIMKDQEKANYVISKAKPNSSVIEKLDFNINVSRTKLTEGFKISSRDQVIFKGNQRNFQHYLNSQNGKRLHYYRQVRPAFGGTAQQDDQIKLEEQHNDKSSDSSDSESAEVQVINENVNNLIQRENLHNQRCPKIEPLNHHDQNQTELFIKQWLNKLDLDFFKSIS